MNLSAKRLVASVWFSPINVLPLVGLIVGGLCLLSVTMVGQGNGGRISGAVTDQTGGAIVGGSVIVTDVERGISRNLVTDQAGQYFAPDLLPGMYKVRAEAKGFNSVERPNTKLEVGNDVRIDIMLPAGNVSEVVEEMDEIPLLDNTSSTLGGTITNQTINDLPLNGRDYQKLLTLRPGVMIYPGGGGWDQSANGVRPESNAYIVDGMTDDEPFSGLSVINAPGLVGDAVTVIPIDAIQEFNTQINPKAEYGWKPGAIITVGLKSGTNNIHGTAYAFGRAESFDARNYFNPAPQPKTPLDFKQFGATGGGAIIKDRLFYFVGYEAQRYTVGNSFVVSVPTTASVGDPTVSIPDAKAALAANGITTLSPLSTHLLSLYPANAGTSSSVTIGFPNVNSSDSVLGKIDYHINNRHTLSGMVFWGRDFETAQDQAFLQPQWLSTQSQKPITGGGSWTWTPNSRWVNEARLGYLYDNKANLSVDHNVPATAYGINTGVTDPLRFGMPQINVAPFNSLGGGVNWPKFQGPDSVWQGSDSVSYLRGKHALKFGLEIRHGSVHEGSFRGSKGQIFFNGGGAFATSTPFEDFLAGDPAFGKISYGNPQRHETQWLYASFFQDDWRATPNLTLNLGLRYEYTTPIREDHNLLGNFDPKLGLVQVGHQIGSPYNPDRRDFAPRIGLAWDVTGKGKTVVRAGGGITYDTISLETLLVQENVQNATTIGLATIPTGAPIVVNGVTTPGSGTIAVSSLKILPSQGLNWNGSSVGGAPLFPVAPIQCGDAVGADPPQCNVLGIDRNFRTPYIATWTLGVQHAFTKNLALDLAYVGNYSDNLIGIRDINQGQLGTGTLTNFPQFPYLGFINMMSNQYGANYSGLQATLTERLSHGVSFLFGYTYSHALDYSSTNQNQFLPQDSNHPEKEYASSDYDIRHRLTLSLTYAIPGRKAFAQILEGWQINSIVTLQSAQPWTVNDTVDNISGTNEATDRWDFFGNPSDFTSGPNPIPYFAPGDLNMPAACSNNAAAIGATPSLQTFGCYAKGSSVMIPPAFGTFGTMRRNMFRDSGFRDLDMSVSKVWKFGERLSAQFRAEFFNILNHPSFANPYGGTSGYGPGAFDDPSSTGIFGCGCATPDQAAGNPVVGSGSNRAMQLGLKLIF
ncbi:MAG: TonB-dependent receptor [Acidobacteria bacterium]|nr:TonB-dependent receptor [Acidobacteriota bacterium]